MTLSASFSAKGLVAAALLAWVLGAGCAGAGPRVEGAKVSPVRLAVLPLENLSGESVPLTKWGDSLGNDLRSAGVWVLESEKLAAVMASLRMRYTGGFDEAAAKAFRTQTGTTALLVTSVETYRGAAPPRVGVLCRLVSTEDAPRILWADRVALTGDDSPGLLGLGLIHDPAVLWSRVKNKLTRSLVGFLSADERPNGSSGSDVRAIAPKVAFQAASLKEGRATYRVVVLPFFSSTKRRNAGEILTLHVVDGFSRRPEFSVVEPGVVRQRLLASHFVMNQGISLADVNLIGNSLSADLIVTGTVQQYDDRTTAAGESGADVFVQVLEVSTRKVVWSSRSYAGGRTGVYLFDWGAEDTASKLAAGMVSAVADLLARGIRESRVPTAEASEKESAFPRFPPQGNGVTQPGASPPGQPEHESDEGRP